LLAVLFFFGFTYCVWGLALLLWLCIKCAVIGPRLERWQDAGQAAYRAQNAAARGQAIMIPGRLAF